MGSIKKIGGFMASLFIGGEAINQIGNSKLSSGVKSATQSFVGLGILSKSTKLFKKWI